jgi:hypothetical protein
MRVFLSAALLLSMSAFTPAAFAGGPEINACGCYTDESGACQCTSKKSKCVCPGECEPVGCEAKRQKDADKEAAAALKKIAVREKQKSAEAAKQAKAKKKEKAKAKKAEPPVPELK